MLDTLYDISWSHITALFLQVRNTPLLSALERAVEDYYYDYSDIVKMLLEEGAVYNVTNEVSCTV